MADLVAIPRRDISALKRSLENIDERSAAIETQVLNLTDNQAETRRELELLLAAFLEFVAADKRAKTLQLAETRIVKVRQQIETNFGFYGQIRRRATGILQGIDAGLVTHDTIRLITEDMMLSAPGYWLAPALVGLGAWARDDQTLASTAVGEALQRNSFKTCLFFALVTRRLKRFDASAAWIEQFFLHQDPEALDREFVVLLDGIANGIFGPDARSRALEIIHRWITEPRDAQEFARSQQARWEKVLLASAPSVQARSRFPVLADHCSEWPALEKAYSFAHLHSAVRDQFESIFAGPVEIDPSLTAAVDGLLANLVTHFDEAELSLRSDERRLDLIITLEGDEQEAQKRLDAESTVLAEHVPLMELLTNAAMFGEQAHASPATQRFAIASSRDWILAAHDRITAQSRQAIPRTITLTIGDWSGATVDGGNEFELKNSLNAHLFECEERALAQVVVPLYVYFIPVVAALVAVLGFAGKSQVIAWLCGLATLFGIGYVIYRHMDVRNRRAAISQEWAKTTSSHVALLCALLAEYVDFRSELAKKDAEADALRESLLGIYPSEHTLTPYDTGRRVQIGS